jgi:HD-GYP domain-containing protein (c-di-GMP phosphodiesterase class II)
MVRMSDVVRGIVRDKPADAAGEPASPAAPPAHEAPPHHAEPQRAVEMPSLDTLPFEPVFPEMPAESAEPLFTETQLFVARVREIMRTGDAFPWAELERLVERCAASLERSGELFWVANNAAAPAGVDYLAVHQARVAILAIAIGASVGYQRAPRVQLGMAGCLIDIGLWQLPESLLRRLDALAPEEQAPYRSHPRLSVEWIRRWSAPS